MLGCVIQTAAPFAAQTLLHLSPDHCAINMKRLTQAHDSCTIFASHASRGPQNFLPSEEDYEVSAVFLRNPGHSAVGEDLLRNVHVHHKRFQVYHLTLKNLLSILSWSNAEVQTVSKTATQCSSCLLEKQNATRARASTPVADLQNANDLSGVTQAIEFNHLVALKDLIPTICGGHDGDPQPRKNVNIQYWPKPSSSPVIFAGGQDRFTEQAVIVRAFPTPPLEVVPSEQYRSAGEISNVYPVAIWPECTTSPGAYSEGQRCKKERTNGRCHEQYNTDYSKQDTSREEKLRANLSHDFNRVISHAYSFRLPSVLSILDQVDISVAIIILAEDKSIEVIKHEEFLYYTSTAQISRQGTGRLVTSVRTPSLLMEEHGGANRYAEECQVQGEQNQSAQPTFPITAGMLAGIADQYSTSIQHTTIPPPYQDQVRALSLAAWKKLNEGSGKSPISGINQKVT
ncbi:mCG64176 [Mus musculus]|nr:mCG64176 [Mus musculus]